MVLHFHSGSREISFRLDDCPSRISRAATPHRSNYSLQHLVMKVNRARAIALECDLRVIFVLLFSSPTSLINIREETSTNRCRDLSRRNTTKNLRVLCVLRGKKHQSTVNVFDKFLGKSGYLADLTGFVATNFHRTSSCFTLFNQSDFRENLSGLKPLCTFVPFVGKNQSTVKVLLKFLGKSGSNPRITDI